MYLNFAYSFPVHWVLCTVNTGEFHYGTIVYFMLVSVGRASCSAREVGVETKAPFVFTFTQVNMFSKFRMYFLKDLFEIYLMRVAPDLYAITSYVSGWL